MSGTHRKSIDMEVRHNAPHTNGQMKNFAVLFDHGQYQMVANGNIKKGCFELSLIRQRVY